MQRATSYATNISVALFKYTLLRTRETKLILTWTHNGMVAILGTWYFRVEFVKNNTLGKLGSSTELKSPRVECKFFKRRYNICNAEHLERYHNISWATFQCHDISCLSPLSRYVPLPIVTIFNIASVFIVVQEYFLGGFNKHHSKSNILFSRISTETIEILKIIGLNYNL